MAQLTHHGTSHYSLHTRRGDTRTVTYRRRPVTHGCRGDAGVVVMPVPSRDRRVTWHMGCHGGTPVVVTPGLSCDGGVT